MRWYKKTDNFHYKNNQKKETKIYSVNLQLLVFLKAHNEDRDGDGEVHDEWILHK